MSNKTLAKIILGTIATAILAAIIEPYSYGLADTLFIISGLAYFIVGSWLSIRILKDK